MRGRFQRALSIYSSPDEGATWRNRMQGGKVNLKIGRFLWGSRSGPIHLALYLGYGGKRNLAGFR